MKLLNLLNYLILIKKKLDENKSNCLTHLRNTVDELKNLLDQRQKALTIQLVHTYDQKKEAVNKQYDALVKHNDNCIKVEKIKSSNLVTRNSII